jgi:hypothetical protein
VVWDALLIQIVPVDVSISANDCPASACIASTNLE